MLSDDFFIEKYISGCIKEEKNIIEQARSEITEIDIKLCEAEKLKLRRMKLIEVLEHLGDTSFTRRRLSSIQNNCSSEDIDQSEEIQKIKEKVLQSLKTKNGQNNRELIMSIGSYDKDAEIIRAIKLLGDENKVIKNKETGLIELNN